MRAHAAAVHPGDRSAAATREADLTVRFICRNPRHEPPPGSLAGFLVWHGGTCGYCAGNGRSLEPHHWFETRGVSLGELCRRRASGDDAAAAPD